MTTLVTLAMALPACAREGGARSADAPTRGARPPAAVAEQGPRRSVEPAPAPAARDAHEAAAGDGPSTAEPLLSDHDLRRQHAGGRVLGTVRGLATYYSDSLAGRRTASGEPYDPRGFSAAHKALPFGTVVRVARADGRDVYVRVNDRGPFGDPRRIIDLSGAAADLLGMRREGVVPVTVEVLGAPTAKGPSRGADPPVSSAP